MRFQCFVYRANVKSTIIDESGEGTMPDLRSLRIAEPRGARRKTKRQPPISYHIEIMIPGKDPKYEIEWIIELDA